MKQGSPKIVVIIGPTASGKTDLSLILAKKFNGEVVSADSRQIYTLMDIGTGKPAGLLEKMGGREVYVVEGIPHYLMSTIAPDAPMSAAEFKNQAVGHLSNISACGKLPLLVGGTGLYVWAIVDNLTIPEIAADKMLRLGLEKQSLAELVTLLTKTDPAAAEVVDIKNRRRVIRALEVVMTSGESFLKQRTAGMPLFDFLQIGIHWPQEELHARIDLRVDEQIARGLLDETKKLLGAGYDFSLPSMSGIGYKQMAAYLRGEMTLPEAVLAIKRATRQYAKRQMTWFKRDKRINWVEGDDVPAAEKLVHNFLNKKPSP